MNEKVVLVTGATGGIGDATAQLLHSRGYDVIGFDRNKSTGSYFADFVVADVTDEMAWQGLQAQITSKYGHINALVNVAGRNYYERIEKSDLSEWRSMFDINVLGMVTSIKYCAQLLRSASNSSIVNMSSISAQIGSVGYASYCATKGAVDSLTKSLALEFAPNVRVNAVAPGWIETRFTLDGLEKSEDPVAYRKDVEAMHALQRVGQPEEVAKVIGWLISNEASFMTGSIVTVDGGYLIKN